MFRYVIMTCRLHVHDVFNEMSIMDMPSYINFWPKFCVK